MEMFSLAAVTIALVLAFEFVNGFHDSANSIATVVATKVLSPVKAVAWAAIFNFAGIYLSQAVAKTIGKGIIDQGLILKYGALLLFCAVMGAILWDLITWWLAIPTSSSHALVGGLIGAGGAVAGVDGGIHSHLAASRFGCRIWSHHPGYVGSKEVLEDHCERVVSETPARIFRLLFICSWVK